jgi:ribosomal protein S3AE
MDKPITLQVESRVADAFYQASSSQQQAIQAIVSLWLKQMVQPEHLDAITQEIRREAAANSLTSAVLDDLLSDA